MPRRSLCWEPLGYVSLMRLIFIVVRKKTKIDVALSALTANRGGLVGRRQDDSLMLQMKNKCACTVYRSLLMRLR